MIHSMCLRDATGTSWYISNRQIHEDLGVPFFADNIKSVCQGVNAPARDQVERQLTGLGFLRRTCYASTCSGARLRGQLVRLNFYGGTGCSERPGAAENSVRRGGCGRAACRKVGRLNPKPWSRTLLPTRRQLIVAYRKT